MAAREMQQRDRIAASSTPPTPTENQQSSSDPKPAHRRPRQVTFLTRPPGTKSQPLHQPESHTPRHPTHERNAAQRISPSTPVARVRTYTPLPPTSLAQRHEKKKDSTSISQYVPSAPYLPANATQE
ncbi:hypothetical protein WHR41_06839 [Cladosporium halotolerans]|uniref:Uncharacterized protein n=1 Tax=Cladosporium halotolerans TaxID=1052096 RepID=A0AB34KIV3_9PEZI